mgnify:CR=1 FL=1
MQRCSQRLRAGESLEEKPQSGRPSKNSSTLRRQLGQIKHRHPRASTSFYTIELRRISGEQISEATTLRALHHLGYTWHLPTKKKLTSQQRAARVEFASDHLYDDWGEVWSFDKAYFNLYHHQNRYWIHVDREEDVEYRRLTRAQEKISVGVACALSRGKKARLCFLPSGWNAKNIIKEFDNTIYKDLKRARGKRDKNKLVKMILDNDGRHHQARWNRHMSKRRICQIRPWPANSPDLNPIENVFPWMKSYVEARQPSTRPELVTLIEEAWMSYPTEATVNLMDSMPNRLQGVIEGAGKRLKY